MQKSNVTAIRNDRQDRAVVFLHGFTGGQDDTWDRFPGLLGSAISGWDVFTVGYATTLLPDIVGVWSADSDLPILSTLLCTQLTIPPLDRYDSFALVAHSMGGLIVQKVLVDDPDVARRVRHVMLFGTPSAGLPKAQWVQFWKRQLKNMAKGSEFITGLRQRWTALYGASSPFNLLVVAGANDQFVPPDSSLQPFDRRYQRVVVGDHVSIVKPEKADAPSLSLVVATLGAGETPARDAAANLRLEVERPTAQAAQVVSRVENTTAAMSVKEIVDAALALDRAGKRTESIELLDRHKDRHTDVMGTLGGRYKRLWFENEQPTYANESDQIYYLAINVAFLNFTYKDDAAAAKSMAEVALRHAAPP